MMILDSAQTSALFGHLPKSVRAQISGQIMQSPADIRRYVAGALTAIDALDVNAEGALFRGDDPRTDSVDAAIERFDAGYDASASAAGAVDDQLSDLLSRDERMLAMAGAIEAAGKRITLQLTDAEE